MGPSWRREGGVAEETRTRGFAAPAFTGCALIVTIVSAGPGYLTYRYTTRQYQCPIFEFYVHLTGQHWTIHSKRGHTFSRFDDLRHRLCAELPRLEVVLDGEIVAIDDEGRMDFWGLMRDVGTWPMLHSTFSG